MKLRTLVKASIVAGVAYYIAEAKLIEKRSISSKLIEDYLRVTSNHLSKFAEENVERIDKAYEESSEKYEIQRKYKYKYDVVESEKYHKTYELYGRYGHEDYILLYLHGGAFWSQPSVLHWKFIRNLVDNISGKAIVPIYPKAPTYSYENVYDMILPIYEDLIKNRDGKKIILMGDSAGGGLALSLAEKLKKENLSQPKDIILLSPWLDISMGNREMEKIQKYDPMLDIEDLKIKGRYYANGLDLKNYLVSPIYGDFTELGKISMFIGGYDILLADCQKFRELTKKSGININYYEYPRMTHVFTICPTPEGKNSMEQIIRIIRRQG